MDKFVEYALNAFLSNHQNTPLTGTEQNYVDVLKSGNAEVGSQLAMNICKNMGVSKEQAIAQARQYFGL